MKYRSLALVTLTGLVVALAATAFLSQQASAQCAVGASTSCGSGGDKQKVVRATPTINPALLSPLVNSPALVKPTPTGPPGNPTCAQDPTGALGTCPAPGAAPSNVGITRPPNPNVDPIQSLLVGGRGWLLIVLLIIVVFLAIAIPTFLGARNSVNARSNSTNYGVRNSSELFDKDKPPSN